MRLSILMTLAVLGQPAWADGRAPSAPYFGSGEGSELYMHEPDSTVLGCPLDDTAAKRALIQKAAAAAASAKDPRVKAAFGDHTKALQVWSGCLGFSAG